MSLTILSIISELGTLVCGIPDKYKDNGLFQINSITHTIENMTWQTQIEGLYRQNQ